MAKLRAGVSSVNITPPIGIDLTGFAGRPSPAVGVHDDLHAKCLALEADGVRVGIVTVDLLGLDRDIVERVREGAEREAGVPRSNLMLNASHTHSGPATISLKGLGERDELYVEELVRKLIGAVKMAFDRLRPARIGFGRGEARIGVNRRQRLRDRTVIGRNPEGPVDTTIYLIRVDDDRGKPMAILFSHAVHPVVLGAKNLLFSADYPGYAVRLVESVEGCVAMFAQGCCGDVNPEVVGGTFEDARRIGTILGAHAIGVAEAVRTSEEAELKCEREVLKLPLQDPPSPEEAGRLVERYKRELREAIERGENRGQIMVREGMVRWAEEVKRLAEEGVKGLTCDFEIQAIQLSEEAAIIGMAGEVFVDYQLHIRSRSPYPFTMVLGYTNGCIGYVPTEGAYPEGGYEVEVAYKYYGTLMLRPESDRIIREGALSLLRGMRG